MANRNSNRDALQLYLEEDDMLDLISDEESNKMNEVAALIYSTSHKTSQQVTGFSKASDEVQQYESDTDLEL